MSPTDEGEAIWEFDPSKIKWSFLTPKPGANTPVPRSYHCAPSDAKDTIYICTGCPNTGRLSDLWHFSVSGRSRRLLLQHMIGPMTGGTSITFAQGRL
ncbi:Kelch repeat protein [Penicillium soppii]|uniref:Kelch repeat protein n=1 Tax=Penicillium soppii TaxID=69789 RepID=UPI002548C7D0|nr:Kelch repeat protein [Penicillium soppii]KAJ5872497.1 Kelch repeat protein [Penicillium soppii]